MKAKRRQRKIMIISAVCQLTAAVILLLAQVAAYFVIEGKADLTAHYGLFQGRERVYFDNGIEKRDANFDDTYQGYEVQVATDKQSDWDFISNLRIDIEYRGHADMYLRVCVIEMWIIKSSANDDKDGDTIVSRKPLLEYDYAGDEWKAERKEEHSFFYYKNTGSEQSDPYFLAGDDEATGDVDNDVWHKLTFLSYSDTVTEPVSAKLYLGIMVQCVQPNRYRQLWNISEMP